MDDQNRQQKEVKEKRGFRFPVFLYINILFAVLLLLSQVSAGISPGKLWVLELISISYPFLLFINLFFVCWWLLGRSRYLLISTAIIIIGYGKLSQLYQPGLFSKEEVTDKRSFKLMSYNVRLFDLYNWTGNLKTRESIFQMLKNEQPDILCLQEYYHSDDGDFQNNDAISDLLNLPYRSIKYGSTIKEKYHWGIATFSRYPILNEGTVFYEKGKSNFCLYSDLLIGTDTVRVYNMHLQSNHFKTNDYKFLESPDDKSGDSLLIGTKNILRRIRKAVILRSNQADELELHIAASPYPVMVCGDFNDPPFSYAYQTIRGELNDAFVEKGSGFGNTYTGFPIPFRIDFILHSNTLNCNSYECKEIRLSDHFPIVSEFTLE